MNYIKIQNINEQSNMLDDLQNLQFAVLDIALYLDTHPNDPVALYHHNQYSSNLKELLSLYEMKFGPINLYNTDYGDTWRYIEGPWPWDIENSDGRG